MNVLTLVTVVLLPSTVLAGIMGMNFQVGLFNAVWLFWVVLAAATMLSMGAASTTRTANGVGGRPGSSCP